MKPVSTLASHRGLHAGAPRAEDGRHDLCSMTQSASCSIQRVPAASHATRIASQITQALLRDVSGHGRILTWPVERPRVGRRRRRAALPGPVDAQHTQAVRQGRLVQQERQVAVPAQAPRTRAPADPAPMRGVEDAPAVRRLWC